MIVECEMKEVFPILNRDYNMDAFAKEEFFLSFLSALSELVVVKNPCLF